MGVKCPKCQHENPDTQKFCGECATPLQPSQDIKVTETLETPREELTRGTTLAGRYEIIEELGKGGMGRVYRVEDTKLNQEVALKFIKPEVARDKKTIERFRNELKTARMIAHKNVCRMFDLGEAEGTHFITMEYIRGEDLKSFIHRSGQLAVRTAVKITKQVCEGLTEAHKLGVVHRDLKPSNIMIDREGNARIMDFGIAQSLESRGITGAGIMIGTPEYMSPEQVEAKDVDQRSDLYSLGIILYQMLTGRVPFEGETAFDIGIKQKSEVPEDPRKFNLQIPENLSLVILKLLEKKKEDRFLDADGLLKEIEAITSELPSSEAQAPARRPTLPSKEITVQIRLRKAIIPVLVGAMLIAVSLLYLLVLKRTPPPEVAVPEPRKITFTGNAVHSEISPDGKFLAFVNQESFEEQVLWIQDLASGQAIQLVRAKGFTGIRWLPNGAELSYGVIGADESTGLFTIPRLGGTPRRIHIFPGYWAWSSDGSRYAVTGQNFKNFRVLNIRTDESINVPLNGTYDWILDIDWSPVRDIVLVLTNTEESDRYTIWSSASDGSFQKKILESGDLIYSPRWAPDGKSIYYLQGGTIYQPRNLEVILGKIDLWKIEVRSDTGEPVSEPMIVSPGLNPMGKFSISSDRTKLMFVKGLSYCNLWVADLNEGSLREYVQAKQLTTGTLRNEEASISPDGSQVVFIRDDLENQSICVMPIDGGQLRQLTFFDSLTYCPIWSTQGDEIAFVSHKDGFSNIWRIKPDIGRPYQFTEDNQSNRYFEISWAPGNNILYQTQGNTNFFSLNPETGEKKKLLPNDKLGWTFSAMSSPDGKKVAYFLNHRYQEKTGIWIYSEEDSSQRFLRAGYHPIGWSPDSVWVYTHQSQGGEVKIIRIHSESAKEETVATIPFTFELGIPGDPRISAQADKAVIPIYKTTADVWMIENFDSDRN